jgi:hypothetical protein
VQICKDVEERVEETHRDLVDRWDKIEQTVHDTICESLPWPLDDFCDVITRIIVTFVKVVIEVVTVIVRVVTRVVCKTIELVGTVVDAVVGVLLRFPLIGRIVGAILKVIGEVISGIAAVADTIGYLIGIRPVKFLHVGILILRDEQENPMVQPQDLNTAIAYAQRVFYDEAHVRIKVLGIKTIDGSAPSENLDVGSEQFAVLDELFLAGGWFDMQAQDRFRAEGFSRLLTIGSPVYVFITRSVRGQATGCSLGPFTDYVTVERSQFVDSTADETVMAHEIGHACKLLHTDDKTNLMVGSSSASAKRGDNLSPFQAVVLRASRHVTFL